METLQACVAYENAHQRRVQILRRLEDRASDIRSQDNQIDVRGLFVGATMGGGSSQMSDRPEIGIQRHTGVGEDGQLEVTETSVETSLEDFGADVDHRDRDSRLDRPEASEFGVDDRPEVAQSSAGDQSTVFADTDADQQTLTGSEAAVAPDGGQTGDVRDRMVGTEDSTQHDDLKPRTRRAVDEEMTVSLLEKGGRYEVRSASGDWYEVDVIGESCTCPDWRKHTPEGGCKSLRRVDYEIKQGGGSHDLMVDSR